MSEGLWRDDLRCGCQKGGGHVCRPSWTTEAEWVHADKTPNRGESPEMAVGLQRIRRGEGTGNTHAPDPHCTILSEQESAT